MTALKSWLICLLTTAPLFADEDKDDIERGRKALLEKSYNPAVLSLKAYNNVWKQWGLKEKPKDFPQQLMKRYGLHPSPYPNNDYPMGIRQGTFLFTKGLSIDCMVCHGGSILGKSYVGLGNSTLDYQLFLEEMSRTAGVRMQTPFEVTRARGTIEAGALTVYLLERRKPDLSKRATPLDLGLRDDMCEDAPAWWLLKKKKTMYHTGGTSAKSVRSLMQFMMSPLNGSSAFKRAEKNFKDIQQYLLSLEAPKYPLPIDRKLAAVGEKVFEKTCARCHGTYGENPTYPNKVVKLDVIGTDPKRFEGISEKFNDYFNTTWFAQGKPPHKGTINKGYQAPPLDGVWATAPYFHNGSVPTVHGVLNSKARPKLYTRSFETGRKDYDAKKLGWKITEVKEVPQNLEPWEQRKYYDTSKPGRSNGGHTFGDKLSEKERSAVIEYLKTL